MGLLFLAHTGHLHEIENGFIRSLGNFHPIFLHFPIALITMTVVAELLFYRLRSPLFAHASRFMLALAAITAIPMAIGGLAYSYGMQYEGLHMDFFYWHRILGISTALFTCGVAYFKEYTVRKSNAKNTTIYYICLGFLFLSVFSTAFLGGEMTFKIPF